MRGRGGKACWCFRHRPRSWRPTFQGLLGSETGWAPSTHYHSFPIDVTGILRAQERHDARTLFGFAKPTRNSNNQTGQPWLSPRGMKCALSQISDDVSGSVITSHPSNMVNMNRTDMVWCVYKYYKICKIHYSSFSNNVETLCFSEISGHPSYI